jgi:hypothetical protein
MTLSHVWVIVRLWGEEKSCGGLSMNTLRGKPAVFLGMHRCARENLMWRCRLAQQRLGNAALRVQNLL